jgi:hypothetical protein
LKEAPHQHQHTSPHSEPNLDTNRGVGVILKEKAFPSRFFKAEVLPAEGLRVVIDDMQSMQLGEQKEDKYVLFFEDQQKGLVLNITRWTVIEEAYGDSDNWRGRPIVLYPDKTRLGGKQVPCVGIRIPKPPRAKPTATPTPSSPNISGESENPTADMDDGIPF